MPSQDVEFQEDLGGARNAENLCSVLEDSQFVVATANILPWKDCYVAGRKAVASVFIEQLFRKAPVANPEDMLEVVGDCEGEGELEGEDEGEEGDDADGEGEMDVDIDGGHVVDEDEMMLDGDA